MMNEIDYVIEQAKKLLSIDSPTGYTKNVIQYLKGQYEDMGYEAVVTNKGGLLVDLGGVECDRGILLETHADTLGGMVSEILPGGTLRISPLGGLNASNCETENCRVITRFDGEYEGTFQLQNASVHVNGEFSKKERSFDTMEVLLDEKVFSEKDVRELGIMEGDIVCMNPRTCYTKSGFLKSRFLDDKLSVAIALGVARFLHDEKKVLPRKTWQHVTVYEEVGHGGAASVPEGVTEALSVDMGCVGEGLKCSEYQVSICAKDSVGPYSYDMVTKLVRLAKEHHIDFAVDVYPHYGSDVDVTLCAGHDVMHGLIGAGVYASHGYERVHRDGIAAAYELLKAYVLSDE
ncbi:MAG: M42 family metallopeptidase [Lachnospiraceae bacterium]